MVSSGHRSTEQLNHSHIPWAAWHEAVCEFHNENRLGGQVSTPESPEVAPIRARHLYKGNETLTPKVNLEGVRKQLATSVEHDNHLAKCRESDGHDQKAHHAYMAKRQKPLNTGGLFYYNRMVPPIIPPTLSQDHWTRVKKRPPSDAPALPLDAGGVVAASPPSYASRVQLHHLYASRAT